MLQTEDFHELISRIGEELEILKKILYRHKSQHGKSPFFTGLKKVYALLDKILPNDRLISLYNDTNKILRSSSKMGRSELEASVKRVEPHQQLLSDLSQAMLWCEKTARLVGGQLRMRVFIPMMSLLLASLASLSLSLSHTG
mmetsp:Transcript_30781/g.31329  ORF Transcript_30781/g.31329 Transcript_30781/m.31329 type:complete len:142 (+) Transcript_30781:102-527(+)